MGNQSSANRRPAGPCVTQSLPRDPSRKKDKAALAAAHQGTKVLPERIPGQRLKTTENGRNLHVQGTISKPSASGQTISGGQTPANLRQSEPPVGFTPTGYSRAAFAPQEHATMVSAHSMTALNHPIPIGPSSGYPVAYPAHSGRFSCPPNKSFTSEPDLRASPTSHVSLPVSPAAHPTSSSICESATAGKIKSRKRNAAPMPPSPYDPIFCGERGASPSCFENASSVSMPIRGAAKSKKSGLFKKKSDSRMAYYEIDSYREYREKDRLDAKTDARRYRESRERSTAPVPIQASSKKELKERARSLDNLQHDIMKPAMANANSVRSLEIVDDDANVADDRSPFERNKRNSGLSTTKHRAMVRNRVVAPSHCPSEEEELAKASVYRRLSTVERKRIEKQSAAERHIENRAIPLAYFSKIDEITNPLEIKFKEVNRGLKREQQLNQFQNDILNVTQNLNQTNPIFETRTDIISKLPPLPNASTPSSQKREITKVQINHDEIDAPKMFFFGMEPQKGDSNEAIPDDRPTPATATTTTTTPTTRPREEDRVKISGAVVEYARHSLRPGEKKSPLDRSS